MDHPDMDVNLFINSVYDRLHLILPDILPIIAGNIDRGSFFKAFRETSRLFKSTADKMFPEGDIDFSHWRKTTIRQYNMVPTQIDSIMLGLPNIPDGITANQLMMALYDAKNIDFDQLITNLMDCDIEHIPNTYKAHRNKIRMGVWLIELACYHGDFHLQKLFGGQELFEDIISDPSIRMNFKAMIMPISVVINNPNQQWNWDPLSYNRNITEEFYLANKEKLWSIYGLLLNYSLSFDFLVKQFGHHEVLLYRFDVPWDYLMEHINEVHPQRLVVYAKPYCVKGDDEKWNKLVEILLTLGVKVKKNLIPFSWKEEYQVMPDKFSMGRHRYTIKETKWVHEQF